MAGTPPWPATGSTMDAFGPTGLLVVRVSRIRAGGTATNRLAVAGVGPALNQPATSATTSVWPAASKKSTEPPGLSFTTTRLASVLPGRKFKLDDSGRG